MYQRRHYEEAARLLRGHPQREHLYRGYVNRFAADNPRFDEGRFSQAVFGHGYRYKSIGHGHESGVAPITRELSRAPKRKPDFIDNLIAYEGGKMSETQEYNFLKKNKGQLVHLQGHYGRALKRNRLI